MNINSVMALLILRILSVRVVPTRLKRLNITCCIALIFTEQHYFIASYKRDLASLLSYNPDHLTEILLFGDSVFTVEDNKFILISVIKFLI